MLFQKVPRDPLESRVASVGGGYDSRSRGRPLARGRVTDPSSLPLITDGGTSSGKGFGSGRHRSIVRDVGSPERTTMVSPGGSKRDSPERTGELYFGDRNVAAAAAAAVARKEVFAEGSEAGGADASGGATRLGTEVRVVIASFEVVLPMVGRCLLVLGVVVERWPRRGDRHSSAHPERRVG